ncbi:DMT family transporter [Tissierella sp. MB52-C2]|uniref:DMT family transporter n=1 Tax=Tissierella sp. MB52-C2 TaxID=3070999 RepID=UPI00280ADF65|nr:DMT family transporter [Tissierella sp. MB52-C2]WMM23326.1 DMT family transporter [Tissierella sp. MB52-C2]
MELTWFSLALLATLFWGLSDVSFKRGTDPKDKYSHLRILIMIGFIMGLQALVELYKLDFNYSIKTNFIYFPVSFLYILSMAVDFYGYRYLQISVGSPVASTSGAMAGILSFMVLGKTMTGIQFLAVSLITIGLVLLAILESQETRKKSLSIEEKKLNLGAVALIFPIIYAVVDAFATFLDDVYLSNILTPEEALISFELTFFTIALISLFYLVVIKKERYNIKDEKFNIIGGICETAGQFFYVYALTGNSVVAAPLMSIDGIVAVIFGRIWLKEKLNKNQYFTIIMITIGVFILGFFE